MTIFQYIQDQPIQTRSPFEGVNPLLADAVYDGLVAAQVNVCSDCGVIQESVDGKEYLPWCDVDDTCAECSVTYDMERHNAVAN